MQESTIIARCQEGDIGAFEWIYERYGQVLLHTANRMLGQKQDAEDAVQTTFIKLYRGIGKFRHDAKFSTYLFRILMNVCYDMIKKSAKMKTQDIETVEPSISQSTPLKMELEEAMTRLPAQQKACFVLFAVEGIPQLEIGEMLGLSLGGVKSNIHHAKNKLKQMLSMSYGAGTS